jgi:hypothetical protein
MEAGEGEKGDHLARFEWIKIRREKEVTPRREIWPI